MSSLYEKYESGYRNHGKNYQRKYPNEELCRFIGRKFNTTVNKKNIKVLEVGCGPGGNLWMLANEGFKTYGIDFTPESILLAKKNLKARKLKAYLSVSDMTKLNYKDNFFDVIIDIFSSCHLNHNEGEIFIKTAVRKLKKGGIFFSYFPSKKSQMFSSKYKKKLIDKSTIGKIFNKKQIYGNDVLPMRFLHMYEYNTLLKKNGFSVVYNETIKKTYKRGKDYFMFIVIEAIKKRES